jgi:pimeloyl-ACP methyl ester carboxylesterase
MLVADDYPFGWLAEKYERFLAAFEDAWMGHGAGQVRRNPSLASEPRYCEWFASFTRLAANPWMARRMAELDADIDVSSVLTGIRVPALVLCRAEDAWLSPGHSRSRPARLRMHGSSSCPAPATARGRATAA